jgi:hypothetical protein
MVLNQEAQRRYKKACKANNKHAESADFNEVDILLFGRLARNGEYAAAFRYEGAEASCHIYDEETAGPF